MKHWYQIASICLIFLRFSFGWLVIRKRNIKNFWYSQSKFGNTGINSADARLCALQILLCVKKYNKLKVSKFFDLKREDVMLEWKNESQCQEGILSRYGNAVISYACFTNEHKIGWSYITSTICVLEETYCELKGQQFNEEFAAAMCLVYEKTKCTSWLT